MLRQNSLLTRRLRTAHHRRSAASACFTTSSVLCREADNLVLAVKARKDATGNTVEPHNFSFSGCGFLLPYHVGVAHTLRELDFLQPSSRVAGASGGAIIAAAIAAEIDLMLVHDDAKAMAAAGRHLGTWGNVEPGLREVFAKRFATLDMDALNKSGRLTITTHQVWPKRQIVHTDHFHSREDLCDALIASCFIPFYLSRQATSTFRGELHVDGGLVKIVPELPDHVRVCALHAHMLRRPDYELSPSLDPRFPISFWDLARFSLFPAEAHVLDDLFELGRKSAVLWAESKVIRSP